MDRNLRIGKFGFCVLILVTFVSCSIFSQNQIPYEIQGHISLIEKENRIESVLSGEFINRKNKEISNFTLVFMVYDQNGEINIQGKSNIVIKIANKIAAGGRNEFAVSVMDLIDDIDSSNLNIDYLYVSRIEYSDGSVWSDPFGFYVF